MIGKDNTEKGYREFHERTCPEEDLNLIGSELKRLLGDEQGIMSSFFLLDPIESCFSQALKLDESYFYGAPLRSMGFFYHRIPSWPVSKGDNKKALAYLEKALTYGPDFYLNHLYIAFVYKSLGNKEKFKYHLEWIIDAEPTRKYAKENNRYKEEAKKLLQR
jgi:tetratricopeptide (TPR) repeat protein